MQAAYAAVRKRVSLRVLILSVAACCAGVGLVIFKVISFSNAMNTAEQMAALDGEKFDLYSGTNRLRWLHFKSLELATRSTFDYPRFYGEFAQIMQELTTTVEYITLKSVILNLEEDRLREYRKELPAYIAESQKAVDSSACSTWHPIDCNIPVPGVSTNLDISVRLSDGIEKCREVDGGRGVCEWTPDRPSTTGEPQALNLINKCVCYSCRGKLPTADAVLPPEFKSTERGTVGKYQCLNDPKLVADACYWDGGNCVPSRAKPIPEILNSTVYMARFERMLDAVMHMTENAESRYLQVLHDLANKFNNTFRFGIALFFFSAAVNLCGILVTRYKVGSHMSKGLWLSYGITSMTTMFLVAMGLWLNKSFETSLTDVANVRFPVISNAWDVLYNDAVLTTSASRFVSTAHGTGIVDKDCTDSPQGCVFDFWYRRYSDHVAPIERAIQRAVSWSSDQERDLFKLIHSLNVQLVDLETTALTSTEPPDASAPPTNDTSLGRIALYGETYTKAKLIYNAQMRTLLATEKGKVSNYLNRIIEGGSIQLILSVVLDLIALLLGGVTMWLKMILFGQAMEAKRSSTKVFASDTTGDAHHPSAEPYKATSEVVSERSTCGTPTSRSFWFQTGSSSSVVPTPPVSMTRAWHPGTQHVERPPEQP